MASAAVSPGHDHLVEQAVELGVFAFLVKPIKEADLVPTLEVVLARAAELRAMEKEVGSLKETLETRIRANSQRARALVEAIRSESQAPGTRD